MPFPGDRQPGRRMQYASLPYRIRRDGEVQVRLITSRETRRWVIPKGWPMKNLSPPKAAARETFEEAGLMGTVAREPIGIYTYEKRLGTRSVLCDVLVFPLKVKRILHKFPERSQRLGFWFSVESAAAAVQEEELKALILDFGDLIARKQADAREKAERKRARVAAPVPPEAAVEAEPPLERAAAGKNAAGKDATGKSAAGKSAAGKSATGKNAAGKSAADKDASDKDAADKNAVVAVVPAVPVAADMPAAPQAEAPAGKKAAGAADKDNKATPLPDPPAVPVAAEPAPSGKSVKVAAAAPRVVRKKVKAVPAQPVRKAKAAPVPEPAPPVPGDAVPAGRKAKAAGVAAPAARKKVKAAPVRPGKKVKAPPTAPAGREEALPPASPGRAAARHETAGRAEASPDTGSEQTPSGTASGAKAPASAETTAKAPHESAAAD